MFVFNRKSRVEADSLEAHLTFVSFKYKPSCSLPSNVTKLYSISDVLTVISC